MQAGSGLHTTCWQLVVTMLKGLLAGSDMEAASSLQQIQLIEVAGRLGPSNEDASEAGKLTLQAQGIRGGVESGVGLAAA